MRNRRPDAFTFIELLIGFLVFATLVGVAVPNFLEAQVRSKVTASKVRMAAMTEALEAYRADHLSYPPNLEPFHPAPGRKVQPVSRMKARLAPAPPVPLRESGEGIETTRIAADRPVDSSSSLNSAPRRNPFAPAPARGEKTAEPGDPSEATSPTHTTANPFGPSSSRNGASELAASFPLDWTRNPTQFNSLSELDPPNDNEETRHLDRSYLAPFGGLDQASQMLHGYGSLAPNPPGGKNVITRIAFNGFALTALTTPVAYLGTLQPDVFCNIRGMPIGYFSYEPYWLDEGWNLPEANGVSPRYLLISTGPATSSRGPFDPYVGPFIFYDPTNGTVSWGNIMALDGRVAR